MKQFRVTRFDVETETFTPLTGAGQKFPRRGLVNFVALGNTLYAMTFENSDTQPNVMYK